MVVMELGGWEHSVAKQGMVFCIFLSQINVIYLDDNWFIYC